jgi:[ribosomal protein S5]-alanine N-acetyltransferase
MILHTARLILRPVTANDLQQVHALHSLPETDRFNTLGIPGNLQETEAVLNDWLQRMESPRSAYIFCLEQADTGAFTGLLGLNLGKANYHTAEVWYKIHPDHWNKGYTTEALNRVLAFCFQDLQLHRIEAGCAVDNVASIRVLEKAGMIREGRKRKKLPIRGVWTDNYFYAILEEDFLK